MTNLQYNHNYPPGYSHAEYEADEMEDKPLSKMDEWYATAEENMRAPIYEMYMKRHPRHREMIVDPLTKQMNDELHGMYEMGIDPETAVDTITDMYSEQCVKEWEKKK